MIKKAVFTQIKRDMLETIYQKTRMLRALKKFPTSSSFIDEVEFSYLTRELKIKIRNKTYVFYDVKISDAILFKMITGYKVGSAGRVFNNYIKNNYRYSVINT